jgi:4-alpha-glucanotransferase
LTLVTGQVWEEKLLKLTSEDSDFYKGVSFYYYVQYLLHSQLLDVSKYAAEKGVVLKGDLPIGIDHDSVDAWYTPHLFNMHKKTGAPPDDYAEMGTPSNCRPLLPLM